MKRRSHTFSRAFTLGELLISMAVLILLMGMVAQLTDSAMIVATSNRKRLDADNHARLIFDRMANDFARMVKRKDVDCVFAKLDGGGQNDALFFFSEAPAYFNSSVTSNKSSTALIGYRITFNNIFYPNEPVLERLGKGLTWDGAANSTAPGGMVFLSTLSGSATPAPASTIAGNWTRLGSLAGSDNSAYADGTDPEYYLLSDQVYRFEIAFLLKDGSISPLPVAHPAATQNNLTANAPPTLTADSAAGYAVGSRWYDISTSRGYLCTNATPGAAAWNPIGIQDVSAIIVAIALLDSASRKIVTSYSSMAAALPDASAAAPIAKTWSDSNYLANSGIPKAAASHIRIYQRYFYLNNN